jgi:hypothetical protein
MSKRLKVLITVIVAVVAVGCVYFALNTRGEVANNTSNPSETNPEDSNGKPLVIEPDIKITDNFTIDHNISKVIFISEHTIYVGSEDGKNVEKFATLSTGNFAMRLYDVSPDKQWVIVNVSPESTDIESQYLFALNLETKEIVKIAKDYWESGYNEVFFNDSSRLLYSNHGVSAPTSYVAVYNFATKEHTNILQSKQGDSIWSYELSPDNNYLAFVKSGSNVFPNGEMGLWVKNLETGEEKLLVDPQKLNTTGEDWLSDLSFVDNGREIFFCTYANTGDKVGYFVTDLNGNMKAIAANDEVAKANPIPDIIQDELEKELNKNVVVRNVLQSCNKVLYSVYDARKNQDELFETNLDLSSATDLGIIDANFIIPSFYCKFICNTVNGSAITCYLIDSTTSSKVNLNELFKMNIDSAIYLGR